MFFQGRANHTEEASKNDFSKGKVSSVILRLALPMTFAQLINVLYSVVDRVYIGHMSGAAALALTGVGLTFPLILVVTAFANLYGAGGAPLFSMARGAQNPARAQLILNNTFFLLCGTGVLLTALLLLFKRPLLFLFGASEATYPYANSYLTIYLCGSVFVMLSLGLNGFINAQGFAKKGMVTVLLGAVSNLILDPIFIFGLKMGVAGAAIATVLSQLLSALWALSFLCGKKTLVRIQFKSISLNGRLVRQIISLGASSFIMALTSSLVQVVCNASLQRFGGDLYVGVMAVLLSVRELVSAPVSGLVGGAQPVMSFNFGAKEYGRVRAGIRFLSVICIGYTTAIWLFMLLFPRLFIAPFTSDAALLSAAVPSLQLYFFGFFMMSLQMSGQAVAVALGSSGQAIFFSLLRKVVIVVPLTLLLPRLFGLSVQGVFLAEPISNFIGGAACFITMMLTIWPSLKQAEEAQTAEKQNARPT